MLLSRFARVVLALIVVVAMAAACTGDSDEQVTSGEDSPTSTSSDNTDSSDSGDDADQSNASNSETESDDTDTVPNNTVPANAAAAGDVDLTTKPEITDDLLGEYDELTTIDLLVGSGDQAAAGDMISMQYVGVLGSDGTEFDASWNRGTPFDFALGAGQVISGWDEGIVGMKVGGRRVLQIPSAMAYGPTARGDVIGADADLLFIVDLIGIAPPAPTPVPPAPAPPVDQAFLGEFEALEITDLVEGSGPTAKEGDILAVQYVGVLASDGTEFDSSWSRGAVPFPVIAGRGAVIDGWNEGLVGMKVGGERVLQIPAALAYGETGAGGAIGPDTDLVFRIHLEELIEAPIAHTLEFSGPVPTEVETATLVDGDGPEAGAENTVSAHLAVYYHSESQLVESTYTNDTPQPIDLASDGFVPGLSEALFGIQAGEVRQVIVPVSVAFPDGVPPQAGLSDDEALVFVVEALSVN